jgi:hypothetical protein
VELALLLRSAARTTTASQLTRHGRSDAHAHPATAPPQAQPAGGAAQHPTAEHPNSPTGLCLARPRLSSARRLRQRDGAERSDGPCGCPTRGFPSVCAWGAQGAGWHARRSARASWTDSPRLSERSAAGAQRVLRCTPRASTPGCPAAQRRGRRQQGRPFFGDFLSARRKKVTAPPGAHPGLRPQPKHAIQTSTPSKPARQSFDRLSPNGHCSAIKIVAVSAL